MFIGKIFSLSYNALKERRVRSVLTIIMVVVGSSLMVALNGLVAGFSNFAERMLEKLAPNVLFVSSTGIQGQTPFLGRGLESSSSIPLYAAVVNHIKSLSFVEDVIPSYQAAVTVISNNNSKPAGVLSIDPQKLHLIAPALELTQGSAIPSSNDSSAVLLGNDIAISHLTDKTMPFASIGQKVKVKYSILDPNTGLLEERSKEFVVKGIMQPVGNPTIDLSVVLNIKAGSEFLHKSGGYDSIFVIAKSANYVDAIENEIRALYGNNLRIITQAAILQVTKEFLSGINLFISSIALVALLVGSVGIATTMFTSVTERTREIGIMKAIGARNSTILALFLVEALIIGLLGAVIGALVGVGGGYALVTNLTSRSSTHELLSNLTPVFLMNDLIRIFGISVGLSIAAGLYPAWKASKLSPIAALRRE
jgi:putative ABC transport system permease protein